MKITKNLIRLQKPRVWVEAITVIIVTAALAIIIAAMDFGLRIGIETLTQF